MISQFKTEHLQDLGFVKHFQSPKAPYTLLDGRLYHYGRFCVPNVSLHGILLHDRHNAVTASYRGAAKTFKTLQNRYYWGSVRDCVSTCEARQREVR
jgi:hypothetical protein